MSWMYWTVPSAIGFGLLFTMLIGLAILDMYRPGYPRKGFLPIVTTRGDRVFMSILSFVILTLIWLKILPEAATWWVVPIAGVGAFVLLKWG